MSYTDCLWHVCYCTCHLEGLEDLHPVHTGSSEPFWPFQNCSGVQCELFHSVLFCLQYDEWRCSRRVLEWFLWHWDKKPFDRTVLEIVHFKFGVPDQGACTLIAGWTDADSQIDCYLDRWCHTCHDGKVYTYNCKKDVYARRANEGSRIWDICSMFK